MTSCGGHIGAQREELISGLRSGTRSTGLATRQLQPGTGYSLLWRPRVETGGSFHEGELSGYSTYDGQLAQQFDNHTDG